MIKFPELFEEVLASEPTLEGAVRQTFSAFEPWLEQSGMPFFPGFTDHSPRHIEEVLFTAASLVSDGAHRLLGPEDVATLCISILLHDCGMHLTHDSFRVLVASDGPSIIKGLGDESWKTLWQEFQAEAQRFGQEKLNAVFGDAEPINFLRFDINNLSERDCLLIGEFVRRHHCRIAHEIALLGVPTKSGGTLHVCGLDEDMRDIAGLVARSHGMSIRGTFDYLSQRYGLIQEYRRIKAPYLMAVLRIADYVQVQSERAIKSLLSVKELRSPISRQEWRNHFAVKDVSNSHTDPEALYVHASPTEVRTYLKLKALFRDIQRELDDSWATLGEVYGRNVKLSRLGLTIRRVRSNLDEEKTFARQVQYIPRAAGLNSSGSSLLKLLIGPLYDYKVSVGVRELLQNSLDACKERSDLDSGYIMGSSEHPAIRVKIFEEEDGRGWLTIVDEGVGMSVDTVVNFFLIAGASFRNSDLWKRQHQDAAGKSRILRGGRFGVGALAAFLVGDRMHVTTRKWDASREEGVEFSVEIDEPLVELRHCEAPIGTQIRVEISDAAVISDLRPYGIYGGVDTIELDEWGAMDWIAQSSPRVEFEWDGFDRRYVAGHPRQRVRAKFVPSENLVPSFGEDNPQWKLLCNPDGYDSIGWSFKQFFSDDDDDAEVPRFYSGRARVIVNGIRVSEKSDFLILPYERQGYGPYVTIPRPDLSIFDSSGICPINLQRSAISFPRMGIDESIAHDIADAVFMALRTQILNGTIGAYFNYCQNFDHDGRLNVAGQIYAFAASAEGVFLLTADALNDLGIDRLYIVEIDSNFDKGISLSKLLRAGEALVLRRQGLSGVQVDLGFFRNILGEEYAPEASYLVRFQSAIQIGIERLGSHAIIPTSLWKLARTPGKVRKGLLQSLRVLKEEPDAIHLASGLAIRTDTNEQMRLKSVRDAVASDGCAACWMLPKHQRSLDPGAFMQQIWRALHGGHIACVPVTNSAK